MKSSIRNWTRETFDLQSSGLVLQGLSPVWYYIYLENANQSSRLEILERQISEIVERFQVSQYMAEDRLNAVHVAGKIQDRRIV